MTEQVIVIRGKHLFVIGDPEDGDVLRRTEIIAKLKDLRDQFYEDSDAGKEITAIVEGAWMRCGIKAVFILDDTEMDQIDAMTDPPEEQKAAEAAE